MASTFQRFKHFLSLPTALILFLSASIGYFVIIDWINVTDVLDETTGYSYGYGYGYDCFTDRDKFTEQYVTKCKDKEEDYRYDYGYGYNPDAIVEQVEVIEKEKSSGGCRWCNYSQDYNNETINKEELKNSIKEFSEKPLSDAEKESIKDWKFNTETTIAYLYAKAFGITTIGNINDAQPEAWTTRAQLAKMMVQFSTNVLWKTADSTRTEICSTYADVDSSLGDLADFISLACEAKIMGLQVDEETPLVNFNPNAFVSRWEFLTVLGRLIFNNKYKNMEPYYAWYMDAFFTAGIIKVNDPTLLDIRAHIWIILQRTHDRLSQSWE